MKKINFDNQDIIAALATPLGESAIGIVRMSGKGTIELIDRFFSAHKRGFSLKEANSHMVYLGYICNEAGEHLDEVLINIMRAPKTYTREDVVEVYCHGGVIAVQSVFKLLLRNGARLAEPGEFTKRAFINGRIDLSQAEAVIDLIRSRSLDGAENALQQLRGEFSKRLHLLEDQLRKLITSIEAEIDFPEDIENISTEERFKTITTIKNSLQCMSRTFSSGRYYREGVATVLIGKPNVGKSTLLNLFLGEERALVTDIPGTTRDLLEETINIEGVPLRLIDTAGIREYAGVIEKLGISRTKKALQDADLILFIIDVETGVTQEDLQIFKLIAPDKFLVVLNKIDSPKKKITGEDLINFNMPHIEISAKKGWNIDVLKERILEIIGAGLHVKEGFFITNTRHYEILIRAVKSLEAAEQSLLNCLPPECIVIDLWEALNILGEITGKTVSEDVIQDIFRDFCVGK